MPLVCSGASRGKGRPRFQAPHGNLHEKDTWEVLLKHSVGKLYYSTFTLNLLQIVLPWGNSVLIQTDTVLGVHWLSDVRPTRGLVIKSVPIHGQNNFILDLCPAYPRGRQGHTRTTLRPAPATNVTRWLLSFYSSGCYGHTNELIKERSNIPREVRHIQ